MPPVDVLVAHFKSSRPVPARDAAGVAQPAVTPRERAEGFLRSLVWRAAEALYVRGLVDAILAARPDALVAAVGDFNDVAGSPVLRALRGAGGDADTRGQLLDCTTEIDPMRRFSHFHQGHPAQIDHVVATLELRRRVLEARFLNDALRAHDPLPADGDETPTVDSDHAPLVVRFG
jgi:predicted extracellular nuclease